MGDLTTAEGLPLSVTAEVSIDTPIEISNFPATQEVTGPLTDTELRATPVPVSGTVAVSNFPATQPVSGSVTVSGTVTASGPLTDTELRATPVPVSGTVTANAGSGTFAISAAALPLPSGAALDATLTSGSQKTKLIDTGGTNVASVSAAGALKVDGSAVTQPISAAALPLPALAATSTKQPALGTAGTASSDVITVQGIASMTALKVDGSGVTQPVSGTIVPYAALSTAIQGVLTLTSTGDNSLIAGGGGGTRACITSISASNTSTTGVRIDFKDGTTVQHSFYLAPSGGGVSHIFPFPWRLGDNAVLNVAISANVTDVRVSATGFRA